MQPEVHALDRALIVQPANLMPRLSRRSLAAAPISIMPRTLDPAVASALDAVSPAALPQMRVIGSVVDGAAALREGLIKASFGPSWLTSWLVEDVSFLARLFHDLTGVKHQKVRLEAVEDNGCTRFHTDNVRYRLVTTYRGPGTEWIAPRALALQHAGKSLPPDAIRRLERGAVAVMRGGRAETAVCPGLLHRSPPVLETGVSRLFLAIDEASADEK